MMSLASRLLPRARATSAAFVPFLLRPRAAITQRSYSTAASAPSSRFFTFRKLAALGILSGTVAGAAVFIQDARKGALELQDLNERNPVGTTAARERPLPPLRTLIRTYVVYSFCSVPALVDWAPTILATLSSIPGLKQITEAVVRATFFDQVRSDILSV